MGKRQLTQRDLLGPGVVVGRELDIIHHLRAALKEIASVEPQPMNSLAWSLVLIARDPSKTRRVDRTAKP